MKPSSRKSASGIASDKVKKSPKQKLRLIFGILFLLVFSLLYYSFDIEPYQLVTENIAVNTEGANRTLRIAVFSDTHLKKNYPVSALWNVVEHLNAEKPDVVVFLGDLYDDYDKWHDDAGVIEALSAIQAPLGKLAVWGNRDYGGGAQKAYLSILDQSGFTLLQNSNWYIPVCSEHSVLFTGLDDAVFGNPVYPEETQVYESSLKILLMHEPDRFAQYTGYGTDLAAAGHTHGGQSTLVPISWRSRDLQSRYNKGLYTENGEQLYVTSGIGTTHISARFLMPPSITIITAGIDCSSASSSAS